MTWARVEDVASNTTRLIVLDRRIAVRQRLGRERALAELTELGVIERCRQALQARPCVICRRVIERGEWKVQRYPLDAHAECVGLGRPEIHYNPEELKP